MTPPSIRTSLVGAAVVAALAGSALPGAEAAQELRIKRLLSGTGIDGCPRLVQQPPPSAAQREEAERLTVQAQQAALVGNRSSARDLFRRAAQLEPTDESLAYQLARAHDELGEREPALREYCRYLHLAPSALDAGEVRARVAALRSGKSAAPADEAATQFRIGVEHFERRRLAEADAAFTMAIRKDPAWADSYYNRAVVRSARGMHEEMARDLERYLQLAPTAPDRQAVLDRLRAASQRQPPSPAGAFARGLVLPGLGQHYTRRTPMGLAVLGGAGGALYVALRPDYRTSVDTVTRQFTDPFGNTYTETYLVTRRTAERRHLEVGMASAVAIALLGATEAYLYAKRERRPAPPTPVAGRDATPVEGARSPPTAAPIILPLPARDAIGIGVRIWGL